MAALAAMRARQSACFTGGLGETEWASRAAAAAVQVVTVTPQGVSVGSGAVIRNSAALTGGTNAVVTALHLVEGALSGGPGMAVGLITTNGEPVGWAEVVAKGHAGRGEDRSRAAGSYSPRGDVVVLRVRGFQSPAAEQVFRAIEGVDVAGSLSTTVMVGEVSVPAGINPGASGSAALDADGNIYGVVVRRMADEPRVGNWAVRGLRISSPDPMRNPEHDGSRPTRTAVLPQSSTAYVEPLLHPEVLAALGGAATDIRVRRLGEPPIETTIHGFPGSVCVTFRALFAPAR